MATKIENLATTLELIRANSQAAEREAKNWQDFVLRMTSRYPEIQIIDSQEEFSAWAGSHPELNIDPSLFKGKEIIEAYFYLREQKEVQNAPKAPMEINPQLNALGMMGLPALAIIFRDAPKILEADKDYQKIIASKKTEWQEKNPGKNLLESEEGLNYLYGDPNDPDKKTMDDEAEEKFRELAKTNNILAKKLEKYDLEKHKIYKNPINDPSMLHLPAKINEEKQNRFFLLKKTNKNIKEEELKKLSQQIEEKHYLNYAQRYQKKAEAYALVNEDLKNALQKIPRKSIVQEEEKEEEKKNQISSGQIRRVVQELRKEPLSPVQTRPVSKSPFFRPRPINMGESGYRAIPRINLGAGGRLGGRVGQGMGKAAGQGAMRGATALGSAGIGALLPWIIGGLVVLLLFVVLILITGGGMGGGTPGVIAIGDISSCKFTRAGSSNYIKSSILQGWIANAANQVDIPPAILGSVAMHESQSFVVDADDNHDAIRNNNYCQSGPVFCEQKGQNLHSGSCTPEEIASGARNAKAIGLMQIVDVFNPGKDLCSITESLSIAANKLKNDGIVQQPTKDQVTAAIKLYYNSCVYGEYSYCDEVWNDLQNCKIQKTPIAAPPKPENLDDLKSQILSNFNISFNTSNPLINKQILDWAWDVLWKAQSETSFIELLKKRAGGQIFVDVADGVGYRDGNNIYFSSNPGGPLRSGSIYFFKQNLIHELAHIIHGVRTDPTYGSFISDAVNKDGEFISGYSKGATADPKAACNSSNSGERVVQLDEDFAETVSYYINNDAPEQNYSNKCPPFNYSINPFASGKYSNHLFFIKSVLGGNNF